MNISAWRSEQHDEYVYVVQINQIKHGDKSFIEKLFQDWKTVSYGWNIKENYKILIMNKKFNSEKERPHGKVIDSPESECQASRARGIKNLYFLKYTRGCSRDCKICGKRKTNGYGRRTKK